VGSQISIKLEGAAACTLLCRRTSYGPLPCHLQELLEAKARADAEETTGKSPEARMPPSIPLEVDPFKGFGDKPKGK